MIDVDQRGALEAVERILNRGGEPKDVLRSVLEALHGRGVGFGAIRTGGEELTVGAPGDALTTSGALTMSAADQAFVDRVATLISPFVRD